MAARERGPVERTTAPPAPRWGELPTATWAAAQAQPARRSPLRRGHKGKPDGREPSAHRLAGGPPGEQLLAGGVLADGSVVEPDRQEEVVGLSQHRTGTDGQGLGDLVAVEL